MKNWWTLVMVAFVALTSCSRRAPRAEEIQRTRGAPASPILSAVTIPPGATLIFLSGQVPAIADPTKPADTFAAYGNTKTQTVSALTKMKSLLADAHLSLGDVVKLTVYLVGDPTTGGKLDFKGFGEAYGEFFGTAEQPNLVARTTVQVTALANPGFLVEIDALAAKAGGD